MMTSSNGQIFRVTGPFCGEFTGPGEFPTQRPVTRSFDVYFDLRLNKRLCKQSWGWWFQTLLCPLWRHSNGFYVGPDWSTSKWFWDLLHYRIAVRNRSEALIPWNLVLSEHLFQLANHFKEIHNDSSVKICSVKKICKKFGNYLTKTK